MEDAPFSRWLRVEHRIEELEGRLRSLELSSAERTQYIAELQQLVLDFDALKADLRARERHYLADAASREAAQVARLERQDQDRRTSRRWVTGASLTALGLVIAAAAILVQILDQAGGAP